MNSRHDDPARACGEDWIQRGVAKLAVVMDEAITRRASALLPEQNVERAVQRVRYMTLESVGQLSDDSLISLPAVAR